MPSDICNTGYIRILSKHEEHIKNNSINLIKLLIEIDHINHSLSLILIIAKVTFMRFTAGNPAISVQQKLIEKRGYWSENGFPTNIPTKMRIRKIEHR